MKYKVNHIQNCCFPPLSSSLYNLWLSQFQSGEYFGAEVCAMDLDRDGYTDLILISAPMYKESDREGLVYVCTLTVSVNEFYPVLLDSSSWFFFNDHSNTDCHSYIFYQNVECRLDSPLLLKGAASAKARFGSSLAVLPDLNIDEISDLAVGAPLENDGQGSIYIFNGEAGRRISPTYSQVTKNWHAPLFSTVLEIYAIFNVIN